MREEPVLFVNIADDFIPYTIKNGYNLKTCIVMGKVNKEAELAESNIRREVIHVLIYIFLYVYCQIQKCCISFSIS